MMMLIYTDQLHATAGPGAGLRIEGGSQKFSIFVQILHFWGEKSKIFLSRTSFCAILMVIFNDFFRWGGIRIPLDPPLTDHMSSATKN